MSDCDVTRMDYLMDSEPPIEEIIDKLFGQFAKAYKYDCTCDGDGFRNERTQKAFIAFRDGFYACSEAYGIWLSARRKQR